MKQCDRCGKIEEKDYAYTFFHLTLLKKTALCLCVECQQWALTTILSQDSSTVLLDAIIKHVKETRL